MRELDVSSVWIISDGKQGHYNQSLGLALALQRQRSDLTIETVSVLTKLSASNYSLAVLCLSSLQHYLSRR
ncbi:MAG: hypothetical protein LRY63_00320 [Nitrincola sp.]|nr:hypothetical protein [Nitrincola sp.]